MPHSLLLLLAFTAEKFDLLPLVQEHMALLLLAQAFLALFCCFLGFYLYRGVFSLLSFLGALLLCHHFLRPHCTPLAFMTACSVLGVLFGFLALRYPRLAAVVLSALITGSIIWQLKPLDSGSAFWLVVIFSGLSAGILTFLFPLWGICSFTSLWGSWTLASGGMELILPLFPIAVPTPGFFPVLLLFFPGLAVQLLLFRKQKLFPRIMPAGMEHRLQQRKIAKGGRA